VKRIMVFSSGLGFFIPIFLFIIASYTSLEDTDIGIFLFSFLWPSFLVMLTWGHLQTVIEYLNFFVVGVGFNVGLYMFLGWLFWLGKTKNRFYYFAPPAFLFLIWNIFFGYLRPVFEFF